MTVLRTPAPASEPISGQTIKKENDSMIEEVSFISVIEGTLIVIDGQNKIIINKQNVIQTEAN